MLCALEEVAISSCIPSPMPEQEKFYGLYDSIASWTGQCACVPMCLFSLPTAPFVFATFFKIQAFKTGKQAKLGEELVSIFEHFGIAQPKICTYGIQL